MASSEKTVAAAMPKVPQLLVHELDDDVFAFSSTRHGGYSTGNYGEFNINAFCGDNPEAIKRNRAALCAKIGVDNDKLLLPHQVHSVSGVVVDAEFFEMSAAQRAQSLEGFDFIATREKNVCIGVSTADCVPVILYSPKSRVALAVHAGWRGTQKRIVQNALREAHSRFGAAPSEFRAVIGPSISRDAFEVGQEVYDAFADAGFDMAEIAVKPSEKWHIDLWRANFLQLVEAGVGASHIKVSGICTYNSYNEFFSARRLGINSGRIFSGIIIKI